MKKGYLGDGVYYKIIDHYTIRLYLSNGVSEDNEIFLDEEMIKNLHLITQKTLYGDIKV